MYLLFGGAVFMAVEAPLEDISKQQLYSLQKKIYGWYTYFISFDNSVDQFSGGLMGFAWRRLS